MAVTENEELYRRIIDAISAGDEAALRRLLAEGIVDHNPIPDQSPGATGFIEWMRSARESFPDLKGRIDQVLIVGDRVAAKVTWSGTHGGTFLGVAPTGRAVSFPAFHILRFSRGQAAEWWGVGDLLAALRQIGATIGTTGE